MSTILCTGGAGFIGSHTCVELINAGYDVVIADNLYNASEVVVERIARITGKQPAFYRIDVTDREALDRLFSQERIDAVIVGADRIARNGDTANKIGTYGLSLLAAAHRVPFYVAAPWSTLDLSLADGAGIPIEERAQEEMRLLPGGARLPDAVKVWNPAFDVTPAENVTAIITERGVFRGPYDFGDAGR